MEKKNYVNPIVEATPIQLGSVLMSSPIPTPPGPGPAPRPRGGKLW